MPASVNLLWCISWNWLESNNAVERSHAAAPLPAVVTFLFITELSRCLIVLLTTDRASCWIQRMTINQMNAAYLPLIKIMKPMNRKAPLPFLNRPNFHSCTFPCKMLSAHMESLLGCHCFCFHRFVSGMIRAFVILRSNEWRQKPVWKQMIGEPYPLIH